MGDGGDRKGLLGDTPVWNSFWENPTLSKADRSLFGEIRKAADQDLAQIKHRLDFDLIHADLVRENILTSSNLLNLIDFNDGGGWIMTRMQETGSETRNQSFVTTTRQLGQAYLEQRREEGSHSG